MIAAADPDGVEPREQELRAKAGVRRLKRRDGITRYIVDADPESDGWLRTALDARTAPPPTGPLHRPGRLRAG